MTGSLMALLAAAAALCAVAAVAEHRIPIVPAAVHMDIEREESLMEKLLREERYEEFRELRETEKLRIKERIRLNKNAQAPTFPHHTPVYDFSDTSYIIRASLGSPPQEFRFVPDTTASATWVVDKTCSKEKPNNCPDYCLSNIAWCPYICEPSCCPEEEPSVEEKIAGDVDQCAGKTKFDSGVSESYTTHCVKWSGSHGRLGATGIIGNDTLTFGEGSSAIAVQGVSFAQASHISPSLAGQPVDGVLGLSLGETDNMTPLHRQLFEQNSKMSQLIALYYEKLGGRASGQKGGGLSLGGVDPKSCGGYAYGQPTVGRTDWIIRSVAWYVDKEQANEVSEMLLDSTTPFIYGTKKMLDALVRKTGAKKDENTGLYSVNCKVDFTFMFGAYGEFIRIPAKSLVWQIKPRSCILAFDILEEYTITEPDVVLGGPLFTSHCVYFDYKSLIVNILKKK